MQKDKRHYRILVLEDNPGDYVLISDYLDDEMLAPTLYHAESYAQGLPFLNNQKFELDLILLDLTLPDKNGEDLLRHILKHANRLPVVVLTGYSDFAFATKSLAMGASDYLLKDNLNSTFLYKSVVYNIERNSYITKLKESQKRYSDLFHLSPQPMWVYDLETLAFLDVNASAIQHYGYSKEEFLGMTIKDIRPKEELHKLLKSLEFTSLDRNFFQQDFIHITKDGRRIVVEVKANAILFGDRNAEIVLANDITEKTQYLKAIEKQNNKLREIAWNQSHVVRAPLARMMGLVNAIKEEDSSLAEKEKMLDYFYSSAHEFDSIINKIVSLSEKVDLKSNKPKPNQK